MIHYRRAGNNRWNLAPAAWKPSTGAGLDTHRYVEFAASSIGAQSESVTLPTDELEDRSDSSLSSAHGLNHASRERGATTDDRAVSVRVSRRTG